MSVYEKIVFEDEELCANLPNLKSAVIETELLFEETKVPSSQMLDDRNDPENDNIDYIACINDIYD